MRLERCIPDVLIVIVYLLVIYGVGGIFEWYRSFRESRETNALQRGHLVFLAEVEEWLVRLDEEISNRPVNPMQFREGTSYFSLEWNNDRWGEGHAPLIVKHYWWLLICRLWGYLLLVIIATTYWLKNRGGSILSYLTSIIF